MIIILENVGTLNNEEEEGEQDAQSLENENVEHGDMDQAVHCYRYLTICTK